MTLNLGVIGISSGNGHPFSWSAICNGYSPEEMAKCPFPVIPKYLSKQKWPDDMISNASVKGVWTQSQDISKSIASASLIDNVYLSLEELVEKSEAILLARDDAENHFKHSSFALKAKKPIFIDKPIALSMKDLNALYDLSFSPNQIFSCSSMSFCPSFSKLSDCFENEDITSIKLSTPKRWERYAVHLIDPLIKNLKKSFLDSYSLKINDIKICNKSISLELNLTTPKHLNPVNITIYASGENIGELGFSAFNKNNKLIISESHKQAFYSFKSALEAFVDHQNSIRKENYLFNYSHHKEVVKLIEAPLIAIRNN